MSKGPLAVRFGALPAGRAAGGHGRAGAASSWRTPARFAGRPASSSRYHWLDDRDNPIVWDGIRTDAPPLAPGERVDRRRSPCARRSRPGRYRLAFDLVAELRAWFSELGSPMLARGRRRRAARRASRHAALPAGYERAPDWEERVRAAHAEGYGVVAGAVDWPGGLFHRRPRELAPYAPGPGRDPGLQRAAARPVGARRASSSSRSASSPGCRRSPHRATSRGSTTAGS